MATASFFPLADTDDGNVERTGASYPPTGSYATGDGDDFAPYGLKSKTAGPTFLIDVTCVRFDTSSLAGATVTGATFRYYQDGKVNADSRSLTADWYNSFTPPISSDDWTATVGTNAHAGTPIADLVTGQFNDLVLTNVENINTSGYTTLRFHISGGEPTGENYVLGNQFGGTQADPELIVEYTTARTYKRLYGPAQLTGSAADLYTCPADTVARVLGIHASNPSGSPVDINLSIGTDAAGTRVYDDFEIPADSVETNFDPYELAAGEKIQGWASSAGTVVLTITGYEDPV